MKKARLLALDVIGGTGFSEIECKELDDYYKALKCDCFDIAHRKIGGKDGKYFDIFVDDIGLFADSPIPSAIDGNGNVMLVGNLVFANHDNQGNTTSLSDQDIMLIRNNAVMLVRADDESKRWLAIQPVEY